jgi:hypothetical protein
MGFKVPAHAGLGLRELTPAEKVNLSNTLTLVGVAVCFRFYGFAQLLATLSSTGWVSQHRFTPADVPALRAGLATGHKTYGFSPL